MFLSQRQPKMTRDSFMKLSGESEAWIMLSVKPRPKSPLIVPGAASNDFVVPIMSLTVLTALLPSRMHATTVPEEMNETSSPKNGLSLCTEENSCAFSFVKLYD